MKAPRRSARWLGILLFAALVLAPGLGWAVEEEIKESGAQTPTGKKVDEKKEAKPPVQAEKTAESAKQGSGTVDPSFWKTSRRSGDRLPPCGRDNRCPWKTRL